MTSINWQDLIDSSEESSGGTSFEPVPADTYELVITDAKHKVASTGRDMWEVKMSVEGGPHKGRIIYNNLVLVKESSWRFFKDMSALGLNKAYFAKNPSLEQVAEDLVDRRCRAEVGIRTYGGRDRNEVKSITPPSSPAPPVPGRGGGSSSGSGKHPSSTPPPPGMGFAPPPFSGEPPF